MGAIGLLCDQSDLLLAVLDFLRVRDERRPRPPHRDRRRQLRDVVALGYADRRFHRLIFLGGDSASGGGEGGGLRGRGGFDALFGRRGQRYWKNVHLLRELATSRIPLPAATTPNPSLPFPSLHILSDQRETDSLGFYGEVPSPDGRPPCSGYFGFEVLNGEVAVWGDFSGLAFYSDVDAFLFPPGRDGDGDGDGGARRAGDRRSKSESGPEHRPYGSMFSSYRLQVMAVLVHDRHAFLGFSNGDIDCVRLPPSRGPGPRTPAGRREPAAEGGEEEYPYMSGITGEHQNEVTGLAAVHDRHLASASLLLPGVLVHWNALVGGDLTGPSSLVHYDAESVMAIASTSLSTPLSFDPSGTSSLVAIGSADGTVFYSCWEFYAEHQRRTREEWLTSHDRLLMPPTVEGHISFLAFFEEKLVVGTNMGSLVVMNRDLLLDGHKYIIQDCCGGGENGRHASCLVEDVRLVGWSILLTSGGCQGEIKFWEWETGQALCRWKIHPGRTVGRSILKSCVVAVRVCHERSSLIALCQDGFTVECRLDELLSRSKSNPLLVPRKKKKSTALLAGNHPRKKKRARMN